MFFNENLINNHRSSNNVYYITHKFEFNQSTIKLEIHIFFIGVHLPKKLLMFD